MPFAFQFELAVDELDAFYVLAMLATVVVLAKRWSVFWGGGLERRDVALAFAMAFFLVIPIGVLLHELGHMAAAWSVDEQVLELEFGLYRGSVLHTATSDDSDSWWVALAGNLAGAGFGFALLGLAFAGSRLGRPLRYVLLLAAVMQLAFALIAYPALSLGDAWKDSDWSEIYDFSIMPLAATLTAVVHAALLGGLWLARSRVSDLNVGLSTGRTAELRGLREAIAADPGDVGPRTALALLFFEGGHTERAEATAREALDRCGENAVPYVPLSLSLLHQGRCEEAVDALRRGLELAPEEMKVNETPGREWMRANLGIALARCDRPRDALEAFAQLDERMSNDKSVKHWRDKAAESLA